MNACWCRLDGGVELAACGVTEVRRELVDDGGELADGIVGDVDERTGDALVVVVDTFNGVVVSFRAETADRGAGADAQAAACGDARDKQGEVENAVGTRRR